MNFISYHSQGQYTVLIIFHSNKTETAKRGASLNTNILIHLQLEVIQSAQRNSTTQPRTAISPTSSVELFLHGITAMNYPPRQCLSTTSLWKNAECSVSNSHPWWAPHTLVQVHNPIAAKLHYSEHCYQEHFVSLSLELMLVHATKNFVNEISSSATDILYTV